jgi:hypothetical protein
MGGMHSQNGKYGKFFYYFYCVYHMIYTAWILCLHPPDVFGEPLIHTVASLFFFVATTVELR